MSRFYRLIVLFIILLSLASAQTYSISTFAGQGLALGDGGPASAARFGAISAMAMGHDGALYIADPIFHQVRRVTPDGRVSLFAGSAVRGFAGDGGPASSAMLDTPTALAVDSGGFVYIGDSGNHRVRVVTPYGNLQTVAGNGQIAPSPAASAVLPGEGGPATAAPLNRISALAFASNGDLLIADSGNNRILRVSSGNISTIAGNATSPAGLAEQPALPATLDAPSGLASDYIGNIYFSEPRNAVVRRIDPNGKLSVLIGSGGAIPYTLLQPSSLSADAAGNIYIVEAGRISKYLPPNFAAGTGASVQALAGDVNKAGGVGDGGSATAAGINPKAIAVDSRGVIYVADSTSAADFRNRVRTITFNSSLTASTIATFAGGSVPTGKGDNGAATSAELHFPRAAAINGQGTLFIADTADNRIRAVTSDGKINTFAGTGTAGMTGDQGPALQANLNPPTGVAVDGAGNVFIADGTRIREVDTTGTINTYAGGGSSTQEGAAALAASLSQAGSLAIDSQNNVYVDQLARVSQFSAANQTIATIAGTGTAGYSGDNGMATAAQIDTIAGIAVDGSGNLYIADMSNGRVRKVDSTGAITTVAGGGTSTSDGIAATDAVLVQPLGVSLDASGNLYIAEFGGNRVRVVDTTGNIRTIAGNGLEGFAGDGGVATNASLNGPSDVKVDSQGNIYITDSLNSSIRRLTPVTSAPTPAITTIVNAASLTGGPVAPGERVILTGTALGPNAKVSFDGTAAPVLTSSLTSTMVVVPYEVAGKTTSQVTVTTGGTTSAAMSVQIAASAPGIYTQTGDGQGQATAFNSDGTLNSPANPVPAGTIITMLCTGAGVLSPAVPTGVPVPVTTPSPVLPVSATLDGQTVRVVQAYSLPGTIGHFAVDIRIPQDASSTTPTVQITVGSAATQPVSIAVQIEAADSSPPPDSSLEPMLRRRLKPLPWR